MEKKDDKNHLKFLPYLLACVAVVLGVVFYFNYNNSNKAVAQSEESSISVSSKENLRSMVYGDPKTAKKGFIFYPGAKVDFKDYDELMKSIANKGYLCISVEMPFDFAILDFTAAYRYMASSKYKNIEEWYVGGHSLGGAMAATCASLQTSDFGVEDDVKGVILLAAYSTSDLTYSSHKNLFTKKEIVDRDVKVLSVYGTNDGVMDKEKYEKYKSNLPEKFTEVILEGGNHAQFGNYGEQDGDNVATMSAAEQIRRTAEAIVNFMG